MLSSPEPRREEMWLVLPGHPIWTCSGLVSQLQSIADEPLMRMLWTLANQAQRVATETPRVRISWKLHASHLFQRLKSCSPNTQAI